MHAHRVRHGNVVRRPRFARPEILIALAADRAVPLRHEPGVLAALRKFPDLKIALSEGGIGWIPYFLERADYTYQHHRHWTHQSFGDKLPSDVFREHIIVCFIDDLAGVRTRDLIGVDTITWECDYPHSDSTWPTAPERLWEALAGVSDDEIDKITHRNAMRHFRTIRSRTARARSARWRRCAPKRPASTSASSAAAAASRPRRTSTAS